MPRLRTHWLRFHSHSLIHDVMLTEIETSFKSNKIITAFCEKVRNLYHQASVKILLKLQQ